MQLYQNQNLKINELFQVFLERAEKILMTIEGKDLSGVLFL